MTLTKRIAPVLALATLVGVLSTGACKDLVAPRHAAPLAPTEPPSRSWDQPDAPTGVLTPDPTNGSASVDLNAHFPVQTIVDVIASGYVVQHDNFNYYPDFNYGPGGRTSTQPMVTVLKGNADGTGTPINFAFNNNEVADTMRPLSAMCARMRGSPQDTF